MLWLAPLFCGFVWAGSRYAPTPNAVQFAGKELFVDGNPFYIKGLCYSPVPIGETIEFPPFGDYFISDYAYIWRRDLPLIKSMGINTIRIYGWDTVHNVTHFEFLDEVHKYGLKVVVTFYVGRNNDKPPVYIDTVEKRQVPITNFTREVALYGDHPAILMWSFGNELNGPWNGFLTQLAKLNSCDYKDYGRCWNTDTLDSSCLVATDCLYKAFFGFLNDAAVAVKGVTTRPVTSGLADLDRIVDKNVQQVVSKLQLYGKYAPDLAAWALQLYKGDRFGSYLKYFANAVNVSGFKPLVVTEYGVDAYNDPCGWPQYRGKQKICKNIVGDPLGGPDILPNGSYFGCNTAGAACQKPGTEIQTKWDTMLAKELYDNRVRSSGATNAPTPQPNCTGPWGSSYTQCADRMAWYSQNWQTKPGMDADPCSWQFALYEEGNFCPDPFKADGGLDIVLGGFLMAWIDERWKGNIPTQAYCKYPCNVTADLAGCYARAGDFEPRGAAKCTDGTAFNLLAHWECLHDTYYHGLCGYGFESMPDLYMNEEWFGFSIPAQCGHSRPPEDPTAADQNPQQFGLDELSVRPVMKAFQQMWNPEEYAKNIPFRPLTCSEMLPCWQCLQTNLGLNAYASTCASVCDLNPLSPTPALAPTNPAPTEAAPTMAAPTVGSEAPTPDMSEAPSNQAAPSEAPTEQAPTFMSPTEAQAPTAQAPTAQAPTEAAPTFTAPTSSSLPPSSSSMPPTPMVADEMLQVTLRLTNHSAQWEDTPVFGAEFVRQLGEMISVPTLSKRVVVDSIKKEPGKMSTLFVFRITPAGTSGGDTSHQLYEKIVSEFKKLSQDPLYGCKQNCTAYTWPPTCQDASDPTSKCLLRMVDASYVQFDTPTTPVTTVPPTAQSSPWGVVTIITLSIVGVVLLLVLVLFCRRKTGRREDKYTPVTDEPVNAAYVPPATTGAQVN